MRALILFNNGKSLQIRDEVWPPPVTLTAPDIGVEPAARKLQRIRAATGVDVALKPARRVPPPRAQFRLVTGTFEPKRPDDLAIYEEIA